MEPFVTVSAEVTAAEPVEPAARADAEETTGRPGSAGAVAPAPTVDRTGEDVPVGTGSAGPAEPDRRPRSNHASATGPLGSAGSRSAAAPTAAAARPRSASAG
ncbi:hypothetical protein [Catellatospora sp. NPDC049133]|uniref:hypothetical protein n=1 Tax=Catellatospora sp. NPDC049133 TaxID=3155499 RepID=UPI0033D9C8C1